MRHLKTLKSPRLLHLMAGRFAQSTSTKSVGSTARLGQDCKIWIETSCQFVNSNWEVVFAQRMTRSQILPFNLMLNQRPRSCKSVSRG